jgi:hypothetical protein
LLIFRQRSFQFAAMPVDLIGLLLGALPALGLQSQGLH